MSVCDSIAVGEVLDVVITKIEDRGIYVTYKDIVGFVDLIHLSWGVFREQSSRFYRVGDRIKVKVLFVQGCEFYSFGASVKELMPLSNPWLYPELFAVGIRLEVTVKKILDFGCFVNLGFGIEAFLPKENVKNDLCIGDFIVVKIVSVNISSPRKIIVEMI
jgi:ribosomal protein S1